MTHTTMENLIRRAFIDEDSSIGFSFQGGEPTLAGYDFYIDFVKTVERYNTRNVKISYAIQTNACFLNQKLCHLFREYDFLCGVSLDGTEFLHNANRVDTNGNGTYADAKRGLSLLKKNLVDVNILCVVTEETCRHAQEIWNALYPYTFIQFIPCIDGFECEKCEDPSVSLAPSPLSYGRFLCQMYDLYEAHLRSGHPVFERRLDNYIDMLIGHQPEMCGMCGQCGGYFLVEADGSVFPCDFYVLDPCLLGNINTTSFARLRRSENMLRFRKEGCTLPPECRTCAWFSLCRGGCRRDREPYRDGVPSSNRFCESYRIFFESRLSNMKKTAFAVSEPISDNRT